MSAVFEVRIHAMERLNLKDGSVARLSIARDKTDEPRLNYPTRRKASTDILRTVEAFRLVRRVESSWRL